jgi:hypothetical protein
MAISVRLDQQTTRALEKAAAASGLSKSDLVRRCLVEFLNRQQPRPLAWELGKDVFGRFGSGRSDLSQNRKQVIRERIHGRKIVVDSGPLVALFDQHDQHDPRAVDFVRLVNGEIISNLAIVTEFVTSLTSTFAHKATSWDGSDAEPLPSFLSKS